MEKESYTAMAILFARYEMRHLAEYPHAMDYKISRLKKFCEMNSIKVLASYEAIGPIEQFERSFIPDIRRHKRGFTSDATLLVIDQWDDLCHWIRHDHITTELKKLNLTVKTLVSYEESSSIRE